MNLIYFKRWLSCSRQLHFRVFRLCRTREKSRAWYRIYHYSGTLIITGFCLASLFKNACRQCFLHVTVSRIHLSGCNAQTRTFIRGNPASDHEYSDYAKLQYCIIPTGKKQIGWIKEIIKELHAKENAAIQDESNCFLTVNWWYSTVKWKRAEAERRSSFQFNVSDPSPRVLLTWPYANSRRLSALRSFRSIQMQIAGYDRNELSR